ncbi:hypothetical protein CsSME_00032731 [Camellia sinensis var. sinensis]
MDGGNENFYDNRVVKTTSMKTTTVSKKKKRPIWPGAKLASFFKSLFTNGNSKKTKKRKAKSTQSCTCSWASTCSAAVREILKGHAKNAMVLRNENASGNEDDYEDAATDSSSDLFELDHLP